MKKKNDYRLQVLLMILGASIVVVWMQFGLGFDFSFGSAATREYNPYNSYCDASRTLSCRAARSRMPAERAACIERPRRSDGTASAECQRYDATNHFIDAYCRSC